MLAVNPITNPVVTGFAGKKPEDAPDLFGKLFSGLFAALLVAATIWTFVQLIWGGIDWISSGGDKGKLELAQNRLTSALVGIFLVFASWAVYLLVLQFFGLSPLGGKGGIELQLPTIF